MKKTYQEPWKLFANKYLYTVCPSTPSKGDIKIIESYLRDRLKKKNKPNILMLGCTHSYRRLMTKYKLYVEMVDVNKTMYLANLNELKDVKRKEKFIENLGL